MASHMHDNNKIYCPKLLLSPSFGEELQQQQKITQIKVANCIS